MNTVLTVIKTKSRIFLIFVFRNHFVQKFQFFVIVIAQFLAKTITLHSCAKSCKNYDLNSIFMGNFVQNWFCIDTKLM